MRLAIAVIAVFLVGNVVAEPIEDIEGTKVLCATAAEALGQGKVEESFEILTPYWPLAVEEIDNLKYQTESQLKMLSSRFGKILGSDYVSTKVAGKSFVQHTYVGKFEKHAIRYICVFYKPKNHWYVNAVYWDDKTQLLFD